MDSISRMTQIRQTIVQKIGHKIKIRIIRIKRLTMRIMRSIIST